MNKNIFQTMFNLCVQPESQWDKLADARKEENGDAFLSKFVYPLIGIAAVCTFLGELFTKQAFLLEAAIKKTTVLVVTLFAGFFLASFLLNEVLKLGFRKSNNLVRTQHFVGYVSSFAYLTIAVQALFPELFFLRFALLYVLYIIWIGSIKYMEIEETNRIKFLLFSMFILFISPVLIEKIIFLLMPGMVVK